MNVMNEPQADIIINHLAKIYVHLLSHSGRIENRLAAIEKRLEAKQFEFPGSIFNDNDPCDTDWEASARHLNSFSSKDKPNE